MTSIFRFTKLILAVLAVIVSAVVAIVSPAAAETYTIKMGTDGGLLAYEPAQVTVDPGDTVVWVNNKAFPHNVVFDKVPGGDAALAKSLSSAKLLSKGGQEYSVTFPADAPAGEYSYFCQPHRGAGMAGKIVVE
jgi:plastocyanin